MIKTKIADKPYNIDSSWNDVPFLKYCDVVMCHTEPFMNRLAVYTGIELDILNKLTYPAILQLASLVEFMDDPDSVTGFAVGYESKINVGHETYGKLEISKQAIQNAKIPMLGAVAMIKQYTGEDISDKPITETIGQVVFFLTRLESLWSNSSGSEITNQAEKNWKQVLRSLESLAHMELQPLTQERIT